MSLKNVISKLDIGMLTEQVLIDRQTILTQLSESHQEIDSSLLPENLRAEYQENVQLVNGLYDDEKATVDDCQLISADDFEMYFNRLDRIDKSLQSCAQDSKPTIAASQSQVVRRQNETMKRMGSINDISRLVCRTSSLNNLSNKTFAEPRMPPPSSLKGTAVNKLLNVHKPTEIDTKTYQVTAEMLAEFNALKDEIKKQLTDLNGESDVTAVQFEGFKNKLSASKDRLQLFFEKVIKNQIYTSSTDNQDPVRSLDEDILQQLQNLVKVRNIRVFFLAFFQF